MRRSIPAVVAATTPALMTCASRPFALRRASSCAGNALCLPTPHPQVLRPPPPRSGLGRPQRASTPSGEEQRPMLRQISGSWRSTRPKSAMYIEQCKERFSPQREITGKMECAEILARRRPRLRPRGSCTRAPRRRGMTRTCRLVLGEPRYPRCRWRAPMTDSAHPPLARLRVRLSSRSRSSAPGSGLPGIRVLPSRRCRRGIPRPA